MQMLEGGKRKTALILGAAFAVLILAFLLLGPPKLLARSESPVFCGGCHVMEAEYEAWSHAGAHRRNRCVDCHLPNGNRAAHYVWKSLDGLKDVGLFYSGMVPERITLTAHGAKVLQQNCVRCHEQTVTMIGTERACWSCHRRIAHRLTGAMQTI
jgi:cytochrome c nitrite reductase small subunit